MGTWTCGAVPCGVVPRGAIVAALAGGLMLSLVVVGCEDGGAGRSDAFVSAPDARDDTGEGLEVSSSLGGRLCRWSEHAANPLIEPPPNNTVIADPTLLTPDESPDGRWHLFAATIFAGVYHHVSDDGVTWERLSSIVVGPLAFRPFVLRDGDTYFLFYEQFTGLEVSSIQVVRSADLAEWSAPEEVIVPDLPWEQTEQATVGNPYVTRRGDEYWLYYSADGVFLGDAGYPEPRVIGRARATSLDGPWTKEPAPVLAPDPGDPWANAGAGSLKLLDGTIDGRIVAFQNGIYEDEEGTSRSAIRVLASDDGLSFEPVCDGPIVAPGGEGWKRAFVYAFDSVRLDGEIRLYFNARDGWADGRERIGLATLPFSSAR